MRASPCHRCGVRRFIALAGFLFACQPQAGLTPASASEQSNTSASREVLDAAVGAPSAADASVQAEPDAPPAEMAPELPPVEAGQAGGLEYVEMMTGKAKRDARVPTIVAIHGLGDRPRNFRALFVGLAKPARILLFRAPNAYEGGGWSWFPLRARDPDVEAVSAGIAKAADQLAESLRAYMAEHPGDGPFIVTGFSQGGMLTFTLAARHPDLVLEAIPVGGWLPPPLWPESAPEPSPPITALHGTDDSAVKFKPTR